jgi:hypothetical protein
MTGKRTSLDGAERRRLCLFRHGAVDYVDAPGRVVADHDRHNLALFAHGGTSAAVQPMKFSE